MEGGGEGGSEGMGCGGTPRGGGRFIFYWKIDFFILFFENKIRLEIGWWKVGVCVGRGKLFFLKKKNYLNRLEPFCENHVFDQI